MPSHSVALVAETESETIRFACTDQSKNLDTYVVRRQNLKAFSNKKLFPGEEVEPHHTTSVRDNGSHNATPSSCVQFAETDCHKCGQAAACTLTRSRKKIVCCKQAVCG